MGTTLVPAGLPRSVAPVSSAGLTTAIDNFGLDLLKATSASAESKGGNVIVSPLSVHAALSMTANGATDETAKQMRAVLHTDAMDPVEANKQWAALFAGLAARSPEQTLEIANSLWARKGIAFKQPFLDADRDHFGAQVSTLDFAKDDVAAAINAWVSRNTHNMITKMVDQVPSDAVMYLANAVYFKGDWDDPFTHEGTRDQAFTRADGSHVNTAMMHKQQGLPYAVNGALQATQLDYKGLDASFVVMLPRPGVSTDAALASLEATGFSDLVHALASPDTTEVVLALPKLDTDFGVSLSKPLAAMGMPRAFDANHADFTGIADLGPDARVYIGDVLHKTKVKVDEKGTEAAAATVVEMTGTAAAPVAEPPQIICDRPYLFAIVDQKTGVMLFLGVVNDPSK